MEDTATLEKGVAAGQIPERIGKTVTGVPHKIGNGFIARHFSEEMFSGNMDPLLMVDHFVMTEPTFEPHLHAGISAVTAMFEDSTGAFLNRDTLGHKVSLRAGDLYWLTAASGAVHEETPEAAARVHGLQIFVNLPASLKSKPARALHVQAKDVPILEDQGSRVRVVLGCSAHATNPECRPEDLTFLDGFLRQGGRFVHRLPADRQAWIYAVEGELTIQVDNEERILVAGTATTVNAGPETDIAVRSGEPSHFVLLAGKPIREPFVKHGPLVMSTAADIRRTLAGYQAGKFGHIAG